MDNSAKNADFRENKLSSFFCQTSELNSCSNYENFSDFSPKLKGRKPPYVW